MPDGKRLTGDIKEERPSVTGKPPLYITLNCDCPILINPHFRQTINTMEKMDELIRGVQEIFPDEV